MEPDDPPDWPARRIAPSRATDRPGPGRLSRRGLLRRSLAGAAAMWAATLGSVGLRGLWPSAASTVTRVRVGTLDQLVADNPGLPIREGFPAYVRAARAFVVLVDPARQGFLQGSDPTGDGTALNVRALSQICPHLGCRPNPCVDDFWMHCPCHQSRYDRLGIKAAGEQFGPAPRSMDRLAIEVDEDGVLTIDAAAVTIGPQPVELGSPGLIPPRVPSGCR